MPQLTEAEVRVGLTVPTVATATEEGNSIFDLWWKSGSTTGGAARSAAMTCRPRAAGTAGSAGTSGLGKALGFRRQVVSSTVLSRARCGSGGSPLGLAL